MDNKDKAILYKVDHIEKYLQNTVVARVTNIIVFYVVMRMDKKNTMIQMLPQSLFINPFHL